MSSGGNHVYYFSLRYLPSTELGRLHPGPARGRFRSRDEAERIRRHCPHADLIEVVDLRPDNLARPDREQVTEMDEMGADA